MHVNIGVCAANVELAALVLVFWGVYEAEVEVDSANWADDSDVAAAAAITTDSSSVGSEGVESFTGDSMEGVSVLNGEGANSDS